MSLRFQINVQFELSLAVRGYSGILRFFLELWTCSTSGTTITIIYSSRRRRVKGPYIGKGLIKHSLNALAGLRSWKQILGSGNGLLLSAVRLQHSKGGRTFGMSSRPHFTVCQIATILQVQSQCLDIVEVSEFVRQNFINFVLVGGDSILTQHNRKGLKEIQIVKKMQVRNE